MLPLLLEASREVREHLLAESSAAEQALLASFLRATRRTRRPVVCLNDRIVISNDAARGLAPADYAVLWEHFAAGGRGTERVVPHLELSEGRVYEARSRPGGGRFGGGGCDRRAQAARPPTPSDGRPARRRRSTPGRPSLAAASPGGASSPRSSCRRATTTPSSSPDHGAWASCGAPPPSMPEAGGGHSP